MIKKECLKCSTNFWIFPYEAKISKFCSRKCYWQSLLGNSGYWLGKKRSLSDRKRMSDSHKGKPSWRKGKKFSPRSQETKQKISKALLGYKHLGEFGEKISKRMKGKSLMLGKHHSLDTRIKMRKSQLRLLKGKPTLTPQDKLARMGIDYKMWREQVFERDNYTCQNCGYKSKGKRPADIHPDHIKPFSLYPELRFVVVNGRTLCVVCHRKIGTKVNQFTLPNYYDPPNPIIITHQMLYDLV